MAKIELAGVVKAFERGAEAVNNVSLMIEDGEFMVFVGPSGCGKTTLLRLIAGLESPTRGTITIGDRVVNRVLPKDRDIAMVFQDYALYPHMTVEANIGFGLRLRRMSKRETRMRVCEVAEMLEITQLLGRKPAALSGGQRQRVAIGRAIARHPSAYLMDEPLSNLDAKLRVHMRAELVRLRNRLRSTVVFVTHDQVEAMTLGDRVAVIRAGVIQQVDTPHTLFSRPANVFVATFIGSPAMNLVRAKVTASSAEFAEGRIPIPPNLDLGGREEVIVGVRPTDVHPVASEGHAGVPTLRLRADIVEVLGGEIQIISRLRSEGTELNHLESNRMLGLGSQDLGVEFTTCLNSRSGVQVGDVLNVSVDTEDLRFFDCQTGEAISRGAERSAPSADSPELEAHAV